MTGPLFAGCDRAARASSCPATYFNPRTPCGVRPDRPALNLHNSNFNPRTPCGVRPSVGRRGLPGGLFQSTHPLRGATEVAQKYGLDRPISIHAPLAGCDRAACSCLSQSEDFNPRTPCGVRPFRGRTDREVWEFQSTHPLRGATDRLFDLDPHFQISIHAPLAGCDSAHPYLFVLDVISIHAPLAGCDVLSHCYNLAIAISIHAPLAGCDVKSTNRSG